MESLPELAADAADPGATGSDLRGLRADETLGAALLAVSDALLAAPPIPASERPAIS